jgi:hypothetical protein
LRQQRPYRFDSIVINVGRKTHHFFDVFTFESQENHIHLFVGFDGMVGIIVATTALLLATAASPVAVFLTVAAISREFAFTSGFSMSVSYFTVTTTKSNLLLVCVSSAATIGCFMLVLPA